MSDMAINYERRSITVDDYHRMANVGIFAPDERVELLDGEIIVVPPMGTPHAGGIGAINWLLTQRLNDHALIRVQSPVVIEPHSEPEPDFAIVARDPHFYADRHPTPSDVFWLIEVSDSSRYIDFHKKALLYARAGIREFWIVDVVEQCLIVHRDPHPSGYKNVTILCGDDTIASLAFANEHFIVRAFTGPH